MKNTLFKNPYYNIRMRLNRISIINYLFIIPSIYLLIGSLLENKQDIFSPYGDYLYHCLFSNYAKNIIYSVIASIIFYYVQQLHIF